MAKESDITVLLGIDDTDFQQAIQRMKSQLASLGPEIQRGQRLMEVFQRERYPVAQILPRLDPKDQRDIQAYAASLLEAEKATEKVGTTSRRTGIDIAGLIDRMFIRLGVFIAFRDAIKAVGDAFNEMTQTQTQFVYWMNINRQTTEEAVSSFDALKKAAHDSNQELSFTVNASLKLREFGIAERDVAEVSKHLGDILRETGVDLTDIRAKAEMGTAGLGDFQKASLAVNNALKDEIQAYAREEAGTKSWSEAHQQAHTILEREWQDFTRLTEAHKGFADKLGATAAAWKQFQPSAGTIPIPFEVPKDIPPELRQTFLARAREIHAELQKGMEQISKEEGLPIYAVQRMVMAGRFSEDELLAANKRSLEETKIAQERKDQDEIMQRQTQHETERLAINEKIRESVDATDKSQESFAEHTVTVNEKLKEVQLGFKEIERTMGDIIGASVGLAAGGKPVTPVEEFTQQFALPTVATLLGIPPQLIGGKLPTEPPKGPEEKPSTEKSQNQILEFLKQVFSVR
jgi:hypothetical protein